jgi:glycosyltransferase involved in cell wall biosynthesis
MREKPSRKRVLFLPAQAGDHPSTTSRVFAYVPLLEQRGWQVTIHEPTPPWMRSLERGNVIARAAYFLVWLARRIVDLVSARRYDVIVVQRDFYPFSLGLLERALLARHRAVVYDTDDPLHVPQPGRSTSVFQRLRPLAKYDEFTRGAATVFVASEELADHVRELNPNFEIFPMTIDIQRFATARQRRAPHDRVIVGWSGGRTSLRYLDIVRAPLRAAVDAGAIVRVITGAPDAVPDLGVPVEVVRWTAEREAEDLVELDVGIVPLTDTPFERGKFPFKAVQYGAAGLPIVASNVGYTGRIVRDGVNGFLVTSSTEWTDRLLRLIEDPELRKRLGLEAARLALLEYSAAAYAERFDLALRRLIA